MLLLSFSAYMCMGSCWIINADEVVCFTFLLFAIEKAICGGRWIYIPFAVASIGLVTVFHLRAQPQSQRIATCLDMLVEACANQT